MKVLELTYIALRDQRDKDRDDLEGAYGSRRCQLKQDSRREGRH